MISAFSIVYIADVDGREREHCAHEFKENIFPLIILCDLCTI